MGHQKTNKKKPQRSLKVPEGVLTKLNDKIDHYFSTEEKISLTKASENIAGEIDEFLQDELTESNGYTPLILRHKDDPFPSGKNIHDYTVIGGTYRKLEGNNYISGRTIRRMLKGIGVDRQMIYAVAAYVKYDSTTIDGAIDAQQTDGYSPEELLSGGWDLYYYKTIKSESLSKQKEYKILKTSMWLDYQWGKPLFARLRFPNKKGESIFIGKGEMKNNVLVLTFDENKNETETCIHFFCNIPATTGKKPSDDWILNAGGITNGDGIPTMGNAILIKNQKNKNDVTVDKITELLEETASDLEREIMSFLIRNDDRPIRSFRSESLSGLITTNESDIERLGSGRDNYTNLKSIFQKEDNTSCDWYSFSRIDTKRYDITFFRWKITFNDIERKVEVERKRDYEGGKSFYKGEFILKEKQLYARLVSQTKEKKLKSIVGINNPKEKGIRFISATTFPSAKGESNNIAVREILCYLPKKDIKPSDLKRGLMNFYTFAGQEEITDENKLYLSSRALSTLSFPSEMNYRKHFARIREAAKFMAGTFYLLMRNKYKKENTQLLLVELEIDRSANVTMKMRYSKHKGDTIYTYYGRAEYYSKNLHIHLEADTDEREKQKIASLIFDVKQDYIDKKIDCIRGLCIKTDHKGKAGAYPLVMIEKNVIEALKQDEVRKGEARFTDNAPKVIDLDDVKASLYAYTLPEEYEKGNPKDYFFQLSSYEE